MAADNPAQNQGTDGDGKKPESAGLDDQAFRHLAGVLPASDDMTPETDPNAALRRARQQQEQQNEEGQDGPEADGNFWGLPGVWKEVYGHDVSPKLQGLIAQNGNEWTSDENTGDTFFKLTNGQEVFMGERDIEGARRDFIGFQTRDQQLTDEAAEAIIELARSRGWDSVKLVGNDQEKALLNAKAEAAGLAVEGYAPNAAAPAQTQGGPQSELDDDAFSQLGDLGQDPNAPSGNRPEQEVIPPGEKPKGDASRFTEPEAKQEEKPKPAEYTQSGPPVSAEDMLKSVSQSAETGERSSQQDSHAVMTADLGGAERTRDFMIDMFAKTAEETKDIADGGTTATAVVISKDDVISVANIGDSPAMLVLHNPETGQVLAQQITRNHNPDDPDERVRLMEEGVEIAEPTQEGGKARLRGEDGSKLAVSRAFGDKGYEGLAQQPDLLQLDLKSAMAQGFEAYVCVSCDGLFEHDGASADEYGQIIRDAAKNGTLDSVAEKLTKHAHDAGSQDNLTALVTKVPTGPRDSDIVLTVADGHGATGADISNKVVESFKAQVAAADLKQQGPDVKAEANAKAEADAGGSRFAGEVKKKDGGGEEPVAETAKDEGPKADGEAADGAKAEKTEKKKPQSRAKSTKKKTAAKKKPAAKKDGDTHSKIAGGDVAAKGKDKGKDTGGAKQKKTASRKRKAGHGKGGAPRHG